MLYEFVKIRLKLESTSAELVPVSTVLLKHILGVDNAFTCQRLLNSTVDFKVHEFSAKDLRLTLVSNGESLMNIKFFTFNLLLAPLTDRNIEYFGDVYNISKNDRVLINKILKVPGLRRDLRKSDRYLEVKSIGIPDLSMTDCVSGFNSMFPELKQHVGRKVYKKLRFLVDAENAEFSDFEGELICKALRAYYMMFPSSKSDAHMLNSLRTACTNHALNIIESFTSNKRNRLVNAGADGFGGTKYYLQCTSENQLMLNENGDTSLDTGINSINEQSKLLDAVHVDSVLRNFGNSTKKHKILNVVLGMDDSDFTEYLKRNGIIRDHEDATDWVSRVQFQTLSNQLAEYVGNVRPAHVRNFLRRVASEIENTKVVA